MEERSKPHSVCMALFFTIIADFSRSVKDFSEFFWVGIFSGSFFVHSEITRLALASPRRRIRRRNHFACLRRRVVGKEVLKKWLFYVVWAAVQKYLVGVELNL